MNGKKLYKETFSHVRSSYEFNMEDFENMKTKKIVPAGKIALIAAVVAALAAIGITASATGFFGLSELVMPREDPDYGSVLTLQGFADSPESMAVGEYLDGGLTLEEAADKYGLAAVEYCDTYDYDDLTALQGGEIFREGHAENICFMYENGTFGMDGEYISADGTTIPYQLLRSVKGSIVATSLCIGDVSDFEEWSVDAGGVKVLLALGDSRSLVLADLGDSFLSLNVLSGRNGDNIFGGPITKEHLEELARSLNYDALSAVNIPDLPPEPPEVVYGAGVELDPEYFWEGQCFDEILPGWGEIKFITCRPTPEFDDVRFFLSYDGKTSDYELHPMFNDADIVDVAAVSFEDLTSDGKTDILVLLDYNNPNTGSAFRDVRIFRCAGDGEFELDWDLVSLVNSQIPNDKLDVRAVRKLLASLGGAASPQVLKSIDVPVPGRTLRVDAVGKRRGDANVWGASDLLVYDPASAEPDRPIQTIKLSDAVGADFVSGSVGEGYTECWAPDELIAPIDINLDGCCDIEVFGWIVNNTIPCYYLTWDREAGEFRYSITLQGARVDLESGQVIEEFKAGDGGSEYNRSYYEPDDNGELRLVDTKIVTVGPDTPPEDLPDSSGAPVDYMGILLDLDEETPWDNAFRQYTVFDLDGDGVDELLVTMGTCEADAVLRVYTMYKGGLSVMGEVSFGHSMLYVNGSGELIQVFGQMGGEIVTRLTAPEPGGYGIREEKLSERELGPEDSYAQPGRALAFTEYWDLSLLEVMDYSDILDEFELHFSDPEYHLSYSLWDLDMDGSDELFVKVESGSWLDGFYVYTAAGGRARPLGWLSGRKTALCSGADGLYALCIDPTDGTEILYRVELDSAGLTTRVVSSRRDLAPEEMDAMEHFGLTNVPSRDISDR